VLKRRLGVLPDLYNAGFQILWVTGDISGGDFGKMPEGEAAKRLKAPL